MNVVGRKRRESVVNGIGGGRGVRREGRERERSSGSGKRVGSGREARGGGSIYVDEDRENFSRGKLDVRARKRFD